MHHVVNNDFVKGTLEHIQKLIRLFWDFNHSHFKLWQNEQFKD